MPRDVSLSDSKCWNGGQEWVNVQNHGFENVYTFRLSQHLCTDLTSFPTRKSTKLKFYIKTAPEDNLEKKIKLGITIASTAMVEDRFETQASHSEHKVLSIRPPRSLNQDRYTIHTER